MKKCIAFVTSLLLAAAVMPATVQASEYPAAGSSYEQIIPYYNAVDLIAVGATPNGHNVSVFADIVLRDGATVTGELRLMESSDGGKTWKEYASNSFSDMEGEAIIGFTRYARNNHCYKARLVGTAKYGAKTDALDQYSAVVYF